MPSLSYVFKAVHYLTLIGQSWGGTIGFLIGQCQTFFGNDRTIFGHSPSLSGFCIPVGETILRKVSVFDVILEKRADFGAFQALDMHSWQ